MNLTEADFQFWAESEGWKVTKQGWPDFICRRGSVVMAVEVKGHKDFIRPEQWAAIRDLRMAGLPTYLWTVEQGLVEVGKADPLGESIQSLRHENERLMRLVAEMAGMRERPVPLPTLLDQVGWSPSDTYGLDMLSKLCRKTHPEHRAKDPLSSGYALCAWLVFLSDRLDHQKISEMSGLPETRVDRLIERGKSVVAQALHHVKHKRLKDEFSVCVECERIALAPA